MKSKWFEYKSKAIALRKKGFSLRYIEKQLKIPRSTLNGWFKSVVLSPEQKKKLVTDWKKGLVAARSKAVLWHNEQKRMRLKEANMKALNTLEQISVDSKLFVHLSLALLYFGEGFKKNSDTGLGNSDPKILRFFIKALITEFGVPIDKIKCELHLRADQDIEKTKSYWSETLSLPINNFTSVSVDERTKGRPTYDTYKGVCIARCGSVHIQRYLMALSNFYVDRYIA